MESIGSLNVMRTWLIGAVAVPPTSMTASTTRGGTVSSEEPWNSNAPMSTNVVGPTPVFGVPGSSTRARPSRSVAGATTAGAVGPSGGSLLAASITGDPARRWKLSSSPKLANGDCGLCRSQPSRLSAPSMSTNSGSCDRLWLSRAEPSVTAVAARQAARSGARTPSHRPTLAPGVPRKMSL